MPTDHSATEAHSGPPGYSWPRAVAAAFCAAVISTGVSFLGRSAGWSYARAIAFSTFLFLIPVLQPLYQEQRRKSWNSRLSLGVFFGLTGGLVYVFVLDR
jgi:hypothetical protein